MGHAGAWSSTERRSAYSKVRRSLRELVALSQHRDRLRHLAGICEVIRLVIGLRMGPVAQGIIWAGGVSSLGQDLTACLLVAVIVHLLEPEEEFVDDLLVLVVWSRLGAAVGGDSWSLGWGSSIVLLRWLLTEIPDKSSMSEFLKLLQKHSSRIWVLRWIHLGLELIELHQIRRVDEILVADGGSIRIMLSLVHFELVGALLRVELA